MARVKGAMMTVNMRNKILGAAKGYWATSPVIIRWLRSR